MSTFDVYQIDDDHILMGDGAPRPVHSKGHLQVLVAPPARPEGKLARWVTELCSKRNTETYGDPGTGAWELRADHRKTPLYLTVDGSEYKPGTEMEQGSYPGWGDLPSWLTDMERPGCFHNWDGAWVLDVAAELDHAKSQKLLEIDRDRDVALAAGFEHDGHVFDSDDKSIQRISAIATLALMDPEFTTPYITQANETITLDAQAIAALGVAAAQHEATMIFQARALKDLVLDAIDKAAVDAIVWVLPGA